jgi:hypothetical protein
MELPKLLPTLLNQGNDEIVKFMLSNPDDHLKNIVRLSKICRVKLTFNQPTDIVVNRRKILRGITEHTFPGFFRKGDTLYYYMKRNGRSGYMLPLSQIKSYEPIGSTIDAFNRYEEFKKKFDLYFITEDRIKNLWENSSAQHGGKYLPSDFRPISKSGKEALRLFLNKFKGINNTDTSTYSERKNFNGNGTYYVCEGTYHGRGGSNSRDIRIGHQMGCNGVYYSSEYHGCGNGRYGILATRSTYLWMEDD